MTKTKRDEPMLKLTDGQVLHILGTTLPLNNARREFYHWMARIEQAEAQHKKPNVFDRRRMELQAVHAIGRALGVEIGS